MSEPPIAPSFVNPPVANPPFVIPPCVIPPFVIHRAATPRGAGLPMHAHEAAQLTFAAAGMVQVHTADGVWLVPPQLAAWVPAGVRHRLDILTDAELWIVHWQPSAVRSWAPPTLLDRAFCLRVTPLLRSLLATAVAIGPSSVGPGSVGPDLVRSDPVKAELVVRLMLHELSAMQDAPTFLPLPASSVGRRVADLALDDHRNGLDVDGLASRAATSVRTISRLFPAETGLTFKAWRQRARIVRAMERLARGDPIGLVATQAGFASTAAFSCAFRQVTTMTPTTFLKPVAAPP